MDYISFIPNHLIHPFTSTQDNESISLTTFEKSVAMIASVAVFIFGGMSPYSALGSLIVLYSLTAFFKYRNLDTDQPPEAIKKTQAIADSVSSPFGTFGKDYDDDILSVTPPAVSLAGSSNSSSFNNSSFNNSSLRKSYHSSSSVNDKSKIDQDVSFLNSILNNTNSLKKNRELLQKKIESTSSFFSSFFYQNTFFSSFLNFYEKSPKSTKLKLVQLLPTNRQNHFFKPLLKEYFNITKVPGNGDCCIYSLVLSQTPNLNATELEKAAIDTRLNVVRYMRQNKTSFEGFCNAVLKKQTPLESLLNAYEEKMNKKKLNVKLRFTDYITQEINKQTDELAKSKIISQYNFEFDKYKASLKTNEVLSPEQHSQRFLQFPNLKFKKNADGGVAVNFEEYLEIMLERGTQFGTQEIRAFAELLQIPVIVYNPNNVYIDNKNDLHPMESCVYGSQFMDSTTKRIYLYHKNGNHYELMTPINNKAVPPPENPPKTHD